MRKKSLLNWISGLVIVAVFIALSATISAAVPFQVGDVFVSVGPNATLGGNVIRHYDSTGAFIENLIVPNLGYTAAGMAFDANGNLYVTLFAIQNVSKFNNTGVFQSFFGSGYNADPESIVFDAAGNAYVGQADGLRKILKFDSNGNPLANYSPAVGPRGTDWIDLAGDQCTIYYTSEGTTIRRFDVCTNTSLSDFATGLHGAAYALRILPDGGVLVADTIDVHRLNASGNIVQTYPAPAGASLLFALNLDPDGTSFWTGDLGGSGKVYKINISTGTISLTINTKDQGSIGDLAGIGVFGEITAAQPTKGSISGMKFNDLNGNGTKDTGEPGLENWTITLTNESGSMVTNITDANGNYSFTNLSAGNYTVGEVLKPGWIQTAPTPVPPGTYTVALTAGENVGDKDFGNQRMPPKAECIETVNPAGKNIPTAGANPSSGQNPDGFYQLLATDMLDPEPDIFVNDTGSGTIFGPFDNGTRIKYTESNSEPVSKTIGGPDSAVNWHIKGNGDAAVYAVSNAGIKSAEVLCKVPPPPK